MDNSCGQLPVAELLSFLTMQLVQVTQDLENMEDKSAQECRHSKATQTHGSKEGKVEKNEGRRNESSYGRT